MNTEKTSRAKLGVRIPSSLHQALLRISERTGIPLNTLVSDALEAAVGEWEEVVEAVEAVRERAGKRGAA